MNTHYGNIKIFKKITSLVTGYNVTPPVINKCVILKHLIQYVSKCSEKEYGRKSRKGRFCSHLLLFWNNFV